MSPVDNGICGPYLHKERSVVLHPHDSSNEHTLTVNSSFLRRNIPFGYLDRANLGHDSPQFDLNCFSSSTASYPHSEPPQIVRPQDLELRRPFPEIQIEDWSANTQNDTSDVLRSEHSKAHELPPTGSRLPEERIAPEWGVIYVEHGQEAQASQQDIPPQRDSNLVAHSESKLASREATAPVHAWFYAHINNPYPSKKEEATLTKTTGLTLKQIRDCLSNLRARKLRQGEFFSALKYIRQNLITS